MKHGRLESCYPWAIVSILDKYLGKHKVEYETVSEKEPLMIKNVTLNTTVKHLCLLVYLAYHSSLYICL